MWNEACSIFKLLKDEQQTMGNFHVDRFIFYYLTYILQPTVQIPSSLKNNSLVVLSLWQSLLQLVSLYYSSLTLLQ